MNPQFKFVMLSGWANSVLVKPTILQDHSALAVDKTIQHS